MAKKVVGPSPQFIVVAIGLIVAGWREVSACSVTDCTSQYLTLLSMITWGLILLFIGFVKYSLEHAK